MLFSERIRRDAVPDLEHTAERGGAFKPDFVTDLSDRHFRTAQQVKCLVHSFPENILMRGLAEYDLEHSEEMEL